MRKPTPLSLRGWSLLTLIVFAVIVLLPGLQGFWNSVHEEGGFTLSAYKNVLTEARQWTLLRNSLCIAVGTASCATMLGIFMAFALEYLRVADRRALAYGTALAFLIPPYISAIAWIDLLGTNGIFHHVLKGPFGIEATPPSVSTMSGVIFVSTLSYYPVVALTTTLAFRRFDHRLEEAAQLMASRFRTVRSVVLPLLAPSIVTGTLIVFMLALISFAVPSLLQVNVYPVEIFTTFSAFYDVPAATAQALPLVICGLAALAVSYFYIRPRQAWLTGASRTYAGPRGTSATRLVVSVMCWATVAVSGILPFGVIIWRSMPLSSYADVFATAKEEIFTSLGIAACAATLITVLAFSLAYLRRRYEGRPLFRIQGALSLLPFLVSGPVIGITLISLWNRAGPMSLVYDTVLVVVFACAARFLFFAEHGFDAALADLDPSLEEAAQMSGVSWWRQVTGILVPLLWPVVVGVWGLSFIFCLGELDATALICPPGRMTLPARIFSLMHYGPSQMVAALSVITTSVILVCAALTAALYHRGRRALRNRG